MQVIIDMTAKLIAEWLRGDEAELIARAAEREDVAPEDALAAAIERRFIRPAR